MLAYARNDNPVTEVDPHKAAQPERTAHIEALQALIESTEYGGTACSETVLEPRSPEQLIRGFWVLEGTADALTRSATLLGIWLQALKPRLEDASTSVLWISSRPDVREHGLPFGPGLLDWGVAPEQMILVLPKTEGEALWAAEEGLKSGSIAGVLLENSGMDLTASRRLSLAAKVGACPCLVINTNPATAQPAAVPSADARWWVRPQASRAARYGQDSETVGRPSLTLTCQRHRRAAEGQTLTLEWSHETYHLHPTTALADRALDPIQDARSRAVHA